ncbi:hypothetical protein B0H15DRAFT_953636 [Mycena belliarum]|uniref:Chromatin elongation factor spt5 n=1 Tax=Mycena belliarum TaxID=1033014 RepID=A0AAD6U020_9AGAR|nr:hypothetical protein B0H15DRAFT_953636 [Mycena belliae]
MKAIENVAVGGLLHRNVRKVFALGEVEVFECWDTPAVIPAFGALPVHPSAERPPSYLDSVSSALPVQPSAERPPSYLDSARYPCIPAQNARLDTWIRSVARYPCSPAQNARRDTWIRSVPVPAAGFHVAACILIHGNFALFALPASSRNLYIDDRAIDACADDADDEMDDEEDDAEAQIRAADARDFPLDEIIEGHESRLRAPGPYRVPESLLVAGPSRTALRMPTPTPPAASAAHDLSPPSFANDAHASLDLLAAASALRQRTPLFLPDPSSRGPTPIDVLDPYPDSRNTSPFYGIPMSRAPSPTPPSWPVEAPSAPTHSRPSSPNVEPPNKRPRKRFDAESLRLHRVRKYLDVHASDSEDGDNDDEEGSIHESDIEWIDDKAAEPAHILPPPVTQLIPTTTAMTMKIHLWTPFSAPGEPFVRGEEDPQLLLAVSAAARLVMPQVAGALPIGTWFYDTAGRLEKALAVVVAPTQFVRPNDMQPSDLPAPEEYDSCELVDARIPLLKTAYQAVKPTPSELVPFWKSGLPQLRGLVPLPHPRGTWVRLRGHKRNHHLAVVISATQGLVRRLPDTKGPDVCEIIDNITPPFLKENYTAVHPTPDEIVPFEASRLSAVGRLHFRGQSSALVPGDRVVIQDGPEPEGEGLDAGDSGYIVEIRDFDVTNTIGTVFGQIAKAKVTLIDFSPTDKITEGAPGRWFRLSNLRRHSFAISPPLHLLDRVSCRESLGSVKNIEDNVVTIELKDSTMIECQLMDIRRVFEHGDAVVVDAGQHKGRQGFVVGLHRGGVLQILDSADGPDSSGAMQDIVQGRNFRVRSSHVNFINELSPHRSDWSRPSGVIQRAAEAAQSLRSVGRRFEGMFVRVVGAQKKTREEREFDSRKTSALKNKVGIVVGDFDSPERAARLDAAKAKFPKIADSLDFLDFRGIMVTVREDMNNVNFTVDINLLVHDATNWTLPEAVFLPPSRRYASRLQPELESNRPPTRPPTPQPTVGDADLNRSIEAEFEKHRIPGEKNGEWVCSPSLINRRIDFLIEGASTFKPTSTMKTSARLARLDGCIGVLALDQPFKNSDIGLKKLVVYRVAKPGPGKMQTKENVPASCLRPLRNNDDGSSIMTRAQRVLILGSDVQDNNSLLGSYAEIRPEIPHDYGLHVVAVKLPGSAGPFFFHILHLCRSLNEQVEIPGVGVLSATTF